MTKKENNIVLFSVTLCWASSYIFIKSLPSDLPSYAYLTLTTGIAAIIMAVVFFKKLKNINKALVIKGFILALLMCVNLLVEKAGIARVSSSDASFISSFNIIFVPLLMLFMGKLPSRNNLLGIAVILSGVLCTNGFNPGDFLNFGTFYMVIACVVMGIYTITVDKFAKEEDPLLTAVVQMIFSAVLGYILWFFEEPSTFFSLSYSPEMVSSIIILAFFSKAYAYIMLFYAQRYSDPLNVTVIASTEPIVTLALSILLPKSYGGLETFNIFSFIGSIVIACGAVIAGTDFLDGKAGRRHVSTQETVCSRVFHGEKAGHAVKFGEWVKLELGSKIIRQFIIFFISFFVLGASFKVMVLVEGYTEIRPVNALPAIFGMIAGPVGALACGVGNLAADLFGTLRLTSVLGVAANFIGAYLPYKMWYLFSDEKPNLKNFKNLGKFCFICVVSSFASAFVLGVGLDVFFAIQMPQIYMYVLMNNIMFSILLGIPVFIVMNLNPKIFGCCMPIAGLFSARNNGERTDKTKKIFYMLSFLLLLGIMAVLFYMADGSSVKESVLMQLCAVADIVLLCILSQS